MAQREWVEKDFYKELGVSLERERERHQDGLPQVGLAFCTRTRTRAEPNGSRRSPRPTACCRTRTSERSTTKPVACSPAADSAAARFDGGGFGGFNVGGDGAEFNLNDLFDAAGRTGGANIGDLFGGLFGRGASARPSRPLSRQRPRDRDRTQFHRGRQGRGDQPLPADQSGAVHQLSWQRSAPGHQPESVSHLQRLWGVISRNQSCSASLSPAPTAGQRLDHRAPLRGVQGHRRYHPHPHHQRADPAGCGGRTTHPIGRAGRGRVARRPVGRPGRHRACAPGQGFGRDGDDLTVTVPVSFTELALGSTLSVPTLDGTVGVRVPKFMRRPHPAGARTRCTQVQRWQRGLAGDR